MPTVRELRTAHKWSQQYLAEKARISLPTVNRIENGKVIPGFNTMRRIADVFGVSVEDIIPSNESNTPVNE